MSAILSISIFYVDIYETHSIIDMNNYDNDCFEKKLNEITKLIYVLYLILNIFLNHMGTVVNFMII